MQPLATSPVHSSVSPLTKRDIAWCLLVLAVTLFYNLTFLNHVLPFVPDEARYGGVAREMLASGDWIIPTINGVPFLDKPPLYYWLVALSIKAFGVSGYGLRFPVVLFASLGALITYVFGRIFYTRWVALAGAFILSTSPVYFVSAHYSNMDLMVAVLLWGAFCCFVTGLHIENSARKRGAIFLLGYVITGFAFLTKGLIALAFPGCTFVIWSLLNIIFFPQQRAFVKQCWGRLHLLLGIVVVVAIALPWLVAAQLRIHSFLSYFFYQQQIYRFVSDQFNQHQPFWFYPAALVVGTLPWSFIFLGLWPSRKGALRRICSHQPTFLVLIWTVFVVVFFSIPSSKILSYILVAVPGYALLLGVAAHHCVHHYPRLLRKGLLVAAGFLFLAACSTCIVFAYIFSHVPKTVFAFVALYAVAFLVCYVYRRDVDKGLVNQRAKIAFALSLFSLAAVWPPVYSSLRIMQNHELDGSLSSAYTVLFLNSRTQNLHMPFRKAQAAKSTRPLQYFSSCQEARDVFAGKNLALFAEKYDLVPVMYQEYFFELPIYFQQHIRMVGNWNEPPQPGDGSINLLRWGIQQHIDRFGQPPAWFISQDDLVKLWHSPKGTLVFFNENALSRLRETVGEEGFCILSQREKYMIALSMRA